MALGSLVHSGLENWYKVGAPNIDNETVEDVNPTPECYNFAQQLLTEYIRQYPSEPWTLVSTEEPILRPFTEGGDDCLMAKVDSYFYADQQLDLVSNEEGHTITLTPGYWVQEYKTKAASISRANYMAMWEANRQASFQLLALEHKLKEPVQGVIVNVIEKPQPYIPKRKCKGCGEQYELASYIPHADGHACPLCGHVQKLKPYEPKTERSASFFRMKVTRTAEQLEQHLTEARGVFGQMQAMIALGMDSYYFPPNTNSCVDMRFGPCSYFRNHTYNISTLEDGLMQEKDTTKYAGLTIL